MLHRRGKHWSQTFKVILSLKLYLFLFADVADPRACSTFSYFSVFIIPEVATGQQTNLPQVPVTCSFLRSCFRAGHETLQEMCCVTKPGLWGTAIVLLIWQCCAEFNFRVILTFCFLGTIKLTTKMMEVKVKVRVQFYYLKTFYSYSLNLSIQWK